MGETGTDFSQSNIPSPAFGQESGFSGEETVGLISRLLDSKLDKKFADFKRALEQKELSTNSQIKKLKTEAKASSSFQFKGNKLQFEFNSSLLDSINIAFDHLHEGDLSGVNKELDNVKASLNKRNKVIRFADKSPAGWAAVEEYESDELADDSEDEKKLRSAERRALSKIRLRKQSRSSGQTRKFQQDCDGSLGAGGSSNSPTSQLFATSHLLSSPFGRIGVLEHHSLPTNALPAGSLGTGQTPLSVLGTAAPTATGPCQLPQPLPLTNKGTLERLGSDEYRNVVDPFSSFVGIEETDLLERSYVKCHTDNKGVATIVKSGSNKVHLHKLAMEMFSLSREHDIAIDMEWIPRSDNEVADYLSKIVDFDDRGVKDSYFHTLNSIWDPFTVDCFANSVNAKVPRFYSLIFQPGRLSVNALAFDWHGENYWLVPPLYLIPRVLVHFLNCKSRGVLVVPFWPSSLFWPYLIQGNGAYKSFVVDFLFVQNGRDVFVHGANKETCFGSSSFSTPVLFLKLEGTATSQVHWD